MSLLRTELPDSPARPALDDAALQGGAGARPPCRSAGGLAVGWQPEHVQEIRFSDPPEVERHAAGLVCVAGTQSDLVEGCDCVETTGRILTMHSPTC